MKYSGAVYGLLVLAGFWVVWFPAGVHSAVNKTIIDTLNEQLENTTSPVERGNLFMYKARNYANAGEYNKAHENYNNAIRLNHKGWIHLERARFFLLNKKFSLAEQEATAAKDETSTLSNQADPIIRRAQQELEKIYLAEHPPEIILDTKADPTRKSRFDYMRKRDLNQSVYEYSKQLDKERTAAAKTSQATGRKRVRRS